MGWYEGRHAGGSALGARARARAVVAGWRGATLASVIVLAGCSSSHDEGGPGGDAGPGVDLDGGGGPLADAGARPDAVGPRPRTDSGVDGPPPGPAVCGGTICAMGEACCVASGMCFDPADASACALPPGTTDPRACASNLDCGAGEMCDYVRDPATDELPHLCTGAVGVCVVREPPELCAGGTGDSRVCGCDGRTYYNRCEASQAGVRVGFPVPCGTRIAPFVSYTCDATSPMCPEGWSCDVAAGQCRPDDAVIACGVDSQCLPGRVCCAITGTCVDPACAECCRVPPPGAIIACRDDTQCAALEERPEEHRYFCNGPGCGPGGGCMEHAGGCSGELAPVCGCDGHDYTNACWARREAVRVAHEGTCG